MTLSDKVVSASAVARWEHVDTYYSAVGRVEQNEVGMWQGRVLLKGKLFRLSQAQDSAMAAMRAVERTRKREDENANKRSAELERRQQGQ